MRQFDLIVPADNPHYVQELKDASEHTPGAIHVIEYEALNHMANQYAELQDKYLAACTLVDSKQLDLERTKDVANMQTQLVLDAAAEIKALKKENQELLNMVRGT